MCTPEEPTSPADNAYHLRLLEEMRNCAKADFDLQVTRIGWLTSRAQVAFVVLGFGLTLLLSRMDTMCADIRGGTAGPLPWWAVRLLAAGAAIWLTAFGLLVLLLAPRKGAKHGPPDPMDLHSQLYDADDAHLLGSVMDAYNRGANANREITDQKVTWMYVALALVFLGMLLGIAGAAVYEWQVLTTPICQRDARGTTGIARTAEEGPLGSHTGVGGGRALRRGTDQAGLEAPGSGGSGVQSTQHGRPQARSTVPHRRGDTKWRTTTRRSRMRNRPKTTRSGHSRPRRRSSRSASSR
jgi:hypothetical protein